jgi:hypothetical protein
MLLATLLPGHHLQPESKDTVKQGLALIASLTALVLALVVASAKETYDTNTTTVRQLAADGLLLDRVLSTYGDQTQELRQLLRHAAETALARLWPEDKREPVNITPGEARGDFDALYHGVAALKPEDDAQQALKARALDLVTGLAQTRFRLFAQKDSSIPRPFLIVLTFWLMILLGGFGLLSPRNGTVLVVLIVCALSVSCAIFLILELGRPFDGMMRISNAPLRDALAQLGG